MISDVRASSPDHRPSIRSLTVLICLRQGRSDQTKHNSRTTAKSRGGPIGGVIATKEPSGCVGTRTIVKMDPSGGINRGVPGQSSKGLLRRRIPTRM